MRQFIIIGSKHEGSPRFIVLLQKISLKVSQMVADPLVEVRLAVVHMNEANVCLELAEALLDVFRKLGRVQL